MFNRKYFIIIKINYIEQIKQNIYIFTIINTELKYILNNNLHDIKTINLNSKYPTNKSISIKLKIFKLLFHILEKNLILFINFKY